ncbi:MAG: nicotinate phosphoribosyltransferase [Spirochaetota bacterium]|nr:MAG: nicotinate phosphoribosyltransferase [Spirochaetota bacterium]
MRKRLPAELFNIPVQKIKSGFYSDKYFSRTKDILMADGNHKTVLMQLFTRKKGVLCGIDEAICILQTCASKPEKLRIMALYDGDNINKGETVMTIEGDYSCFAHLETVYLGVLARGSSIATLVREAVDAAGGKTVLFFSSRFDHYLLQSQDGYAAMVGGTRSVSTDANSKLWKGEGIGTIPHSLIAAYEGNTVEACEAFKRHQPKNIELIALVDFQNDCVKTSLEAAKRFGKGLWGVRLDTAGDLKDSSVQGEGSDFFGVCPDLVWNVRKALDREGFPEVKIVISGGFDAEKIRRFVEIGVPFDAVGVGSWFYKRRIDFTADIVMVEKKHCAKVGRQYNPNPRLDEVQSGFILKRIK